ncbi:stalk domain-containing protein [Bacillus solimangrovi]|uniref:Copper amine oxidase n=1 Tax=Bacillus solimangrovi TaxID=1305675 RepID=A0A1E5LH26_9BACI|nr:stalk domain-containing protein [Bacillus solimangrovi]OEH93380.1 hypothetical protein BFG57_12060 [Bacillus solimangrovi]
MGIFAKIIFLIFTILVLLIPIESKASSHEITVIINGEKQQYKQVPVIREGRTLVPLREIFEALDATVKWDGSKQKVTANKGKQTIELVVGSKQAVINGNKYVLDVPANTINSYTMVPLRVIGDSLGEKVRWDNASKTIYIGDEPNNRSKSVEKLESVAVATSTDDETWVTWEPKYDVPLDKEWTINFDSSIDFKSAFNNVYIKRNMTDKSQSLGMSSYGSQKLIVRVPNQGYIAGATYTLFIDHVKAKSGATFKPIKMEFTMKEEKKETFDTYTFSDVSLGESKNSLVEKRGKPERIDESRNGFYWYVYNEDYKTYAQYGIKDNKVVTIYSNASNWSSELGIRIGVSQQKVENLYKGFDNDDIDWYQNIDTYHLNNSVVKLFYDSLDSQAIQAVFVTSDRGFLTNYIEWNQEIIDSYEKQVFDITNAERVKRDLKPLQWNNKLSSVARNHSVDMAKRDFFDHVTPDGTGIEDRVKAGGLSICYLGENIHLNSRGNAMNAHQGWMNSEGHRKGILNRKYVSLGVGLEVNDDGIAYFTENFSGSCN